MRTSALAALLLLPACRNKDTPVVETAVPTSDSERDTDADSDSDADADSDSDSNADAYPEELTDDDWIQIEVGLYGVCAITVGGEISCWNDSVSDYLREIPTTSRYQRLSMGLYKIAALDLDGRVFLSGENELPVFSEPQIDVSTANGIVMALAEDGTINETGTPYSDVAYYYFNQGVPTGSFAQISISSDVGCALDSEGLVTCWGDDRSRIDEYPTEPLTTVQTFDNAACGLTADGEVRCWGRQIPPESWEQGPLGNLSDGRFRRLSFDGALCVVEFNGNMRCEYMAGTGIDEIPDGPWRLPASFHYQLACAVRTNNEIVCWGDRAADIVIDQ